MSFTASLIRCAFVISCVFYLGCSPSPPVARTQPQPSQPVVEDSPVLDPTLVAEPPANVEPAVPAEAAGEVVLSEIVASAKEDFEGAKSKYNGKLLRFECWSAAFVSQQVLYGKPPAFLVVSSKPKDKYELRDLPRTTCLSAGAFPWNTFNAGDPVTVTGVALFEYGKLNFEKCTFESSGQPAPTLTVTELVAMTEKDADAVAEKYGKGWLNLKGKVIKAVPRNGSDDPYIILQDSEVIQIRSQLTNLDNDPIKDVKAGDEITIGGSPFIYSRAPLVVEIPTPLMVKDK